MTMINMPHPLPKLSKLPETMPNDGSITILLREGVPVFRASQPVQERIESLLAMQKERELTSIEQQELEQYAEIDDYLSHLNRVVRNLLQASTNN